jgi:hypothetical protein
MAFAHSELGKQSGSQRFGPRSPRDRLKGNDIRRAEWKGRFNCVELNAMSDQELAVQAISEAQQKFLKNILSQHITTMKGYSPGWWRMSCVYRKPYPGLSNDRIG